MKRVQHVTGINESRTLTKHISCESKCKFEQKKCSSAQWWNNDKCQRESKKCHLDEKYYIWSLATCSSEY